MPVFLDGAVFSGILTIVIVILQRARAGRPSLSAWKLLAIGIVAAFVIPWAIKLSAMAWREVPFLPALPEVNFDQVFIGSFVAVLVLSLSHRPGKRPRVPLWGALVAGLAFAFLLPPFLYLVSGSYQRSSLRADLNHCTQGMTGEVQPRGVVNICDEPIAVGLCMPGETNPAPCDQTKILEPGESATFDPGEARLSSLPSNLNGLTVVACRPPARPSRMQTTMGRGYEGVCLPPA
ncbi:hypothetical protein [Oricola indica]|jgi:hypothetical protein|uniref:hypothetical protein n=1 Tax=Oricola indica TaxID=2872591 RepID=UPI001CBDAC91|nr:hypothetical protein [Oricola indica]